MIIKMFSGLFYIIRHITNQPGLAMDFPGLGKLNCITVNSKFFPDFFSCIFLSSIHITIFAVKSDSMTPKQ